jgi:hypothetical protein
MNPHEAFSIMEYRIREYDYFVTANIRELRVENLVVRETSMYA